jgi:Tol biopolymer transport system component
LSNLVNPYHAGRPVEGPEMFFGRDDALIWVEQQLTLDRRLLIVHGPDLIGKTSLVRRLPAFLGEHARFLYFQGKPHQGRSLSQVLAALAGDLANQLMAQDLVSPHQVDTAADSATAVKSLLKQASLALETESSSPAGTSEEGQTQRFLLVIDDVHRLANGEPPSLDSLFDFLASLLADVPRLQLLSTLSDLSYARLAHPILLGAVDFRLGPLSSDAAQQLITRPAQGALRFDAGVTKRIAEITSNHPYYLHLFCYTLYNLCARDGWVNQSDIDRVLDTLLALPNEEFQAIWDRSTRAEQAALTALAGLKGAHGPITRQEVINYLRRFDPQVAPDVILDALESLADRGVLVRMGALSYRFAINLFRSWLDRDTDPAEVMSGVDWNRLSTQLAMRSASEEAKSVEPLPAAHEIADEENGKRRWGPGTLSIVGLTGTALIGVVLLALAFSGMLASDSVEATPTMAQSHATSGFVSPTLTATPSPAPAPTPTRPRVVTHSLPAIVYMARGAEDSAPPSTWQLFVMNADGTNRRQITESNADEITPVWSPDGQRIAFVSQHDGNREIYVVDADNLGSSGVGLVNLTQHPAEDWTPAWSPDGQQLVFSSNRQGNWEIFFVNADGTNLRQITNDGAGNLSPVWSPDGTAMAFSSKRDGNWEIYTMPAPDDQGQVTGAPQRLTFSDGNDLSPLYSPQGDRIAFESNREGNVEIYMVNADGSNQQNLSNLPYADDHGPVWSPDGRRLVFYSNREGNWDLFVMSATGENVINLSNSPDVDEQAPAWRP